MKNEYKAWEKERKLIPIMIKKYCKGMHKTDRVAQGVGCDDVCAECRELTDYALMRLEKCPFKKNKCFCSFCEIHCYKPIMREKIKAVMKHSGKYMIFSHPIFAISHITQMIKYKNVQK